LRSRRAVFGLTQEELALILGVSRDTISRWELALVPPRPIALIVWAQQLGRSIDLRKVAQPKG
jgi:transcriptional regulator with XRE-family HTH domain